MRSPCRSLAPVALLSLLMLLAAPHAVAKNPGLSPAKVKQIAKTRKSFEACRKDALEGLKAGRLSKKRFESALTSCKENFPGADLYITCKRQAVQTAGSRNPSQAIEQCRRYLVATTFDPELPVPFFSEAGQLYFASIGLNRSLPLTALSPPNFSCDKVSSALHNLTQAQYLLFGNHPKSFAGLSDLKGPDLAKAVKMSKPVTAGFDAQGFGRIFNDVKGPAATAYFPTAACDFEAEPGELMSGLSAYYLLDRGGASVTPYFGIVYYRSEQQQITTAKLTQALIRTLGPNYKSTSKDEFVTFVAAAGLTEVDDERDPKNLCLQPRQHRFVGVIQGRKDKPSQPEYMILANVKNLCDFGDRLAKRLVQ